MTVEFHGKPNIQRMFEVWAAILAERDGREVVPGSVKVELKGEHDDDTDKKSNL